MFNATRQIYDALRQVDGYKVFTDENDKNSSVWLQFGLKQGSSYRIRFISTDDDNDVAVRVYGIVNVDEEHKSKILPVVNDLNVRFRFVRFCCDKDGDVNVEYDYLVNAVDPARSAHELVIRINDIIEKAYPELMRALWS